ncbi:Uncharacterised protein [Mycobacterium tuberculosis]|nr:Uncharacterised protein [Mycobacterium tuberculosis]
MKLHCHTHHADRADCDQRRPRPAWWRRAGIVRAHVADQPDGEDSQAVSEGAADSADQSLKQRTTRQQRRRHREPHENEAHRGAGECVVANPPSAADRLRFRGLWSCCGVDRLLSAGSWFVAGVGGRRCSRFRHRWVNWGARFSMNAAIPSDWSSVAKAEWKSRRS